MYLVDTSVWIDMLRGRSGARDAEAFERLQRYLSTQRFYAFADARQSHEAAARMYLDGRSQGVTVRSTLDCLIAQCAIEHDCITTVITWRWGRPFRPCGKGIFWHECSPGIAPSPKLLIVVSEDWYFVSHRLAQRRVGQQRVIEATLATYAEVQRPSRTASGMAGS
jgi:predicted nucleic acid-binding protein